MKKIPVSAEVDLSHMIDALSHISKRLGPNQVSRHMVMQLQDVLDRFRLNLSEESQALTMVEFESK